jgi:glutathione S-transferase
MVLKLYGSPLSSCTRRVAIVLKEKEVPYELITINFAKGEHKSAEYREKQPFGQVPYIDDDGFILFESRAICRYIEAKYPKQGTSLIPTELKANARFEQAASIETADFEPSAVGISWEKAFKPYLGLKTDEARTQEHIEKLNGKLDAYEAILSKQKYLAGDEITMADLFHMTHGVIVKQFSPESFSSRPHVAKWFESLEARPSWISVKDGA